MHDYRNHFGRARCASRLAYKWLKSRAISESGKNLTEQAREAVAERKDKIHGAVDAVSVAANEKTHGKYAAKIAKVGQKASEAVEKFSGEAGADETAASDPWAAPSASVADAPATRAPAAAPSFAGGPSFTDAPATEAPTAGPSFAGGPSFTDAPATEAPTAGPSFAGGRLRWRPELHRRPRDSSARGRPELRRRSELHRRPRDRSTGSRPELSRHSCECCALRWTDVRRVTQAI